MTSYTCTHTHLKTITAVSLDTIHHHTKILHNDCILHTIHFMLVTHWFILYLLISSTYFSSHPTPTSGNHLCVPCIYNSVLWHLFTCFACYVMFICYVCSFVSRFPIQVKSHSTASVNNVAMNIVVYKSFWISVFIYFFWINTQEWNCWIIWEFYV